MNDNFYSLDLSSADEYLLSKRYKDIVDKVRFAKNERNAHRRRRS